MKLSMRQVHLAGDKLFVDYSGHTMEVIDGLTGEVLTVQIFVAVLGASNFTYAEGESLHSKACPTGSHHMFGHFPFFGGVAQQTVSDNLKSGASLGRASMSRWSTAPMPNLARHYKTAATKPSQRARRRALHRIRHERSEPF